MSIDSTLLMMCMQSSVQNPTALTRCGEFNSSVIKVLATALELTGDLLLVNGVVHSTCSHDEQRNPPIKINYHMFYCVTVEYFNRFDRGALFV